MALHRCPNQDMRIWKTRDIFEVQCPHCGQEMEFWKDDHSRTCEDCGQVVNNPHKPLAAQQDGTHV